MVRRVAITGYGCLTSVGNNAASAWDAITRGVSGIAPIKRWDTQDWPYPLGGELSDYRPEDMVLNRKLLKLLSPHDVIGLGAVRQAVEHSGLVTYRDSITEPSTFNDRTGIYTASPGNKYEQQYEFMPLLAHTKGNLRSFAEKLSDFVHPMWLLRILPNNVLAYTGMQYKFLGANQNITNHAVSGLQAIIEAYEAIRLGVIDRAVVVSYDGCIEPQSIYYYGGLGFLSKTGIKPFDAQHDGTVLADGAGALVLEDLTAARDRGASIYAEIVGGCSATEAAGLFSLHEDGAGLQRVLAGVLRAARLDAQDIGFISAHGNGNPHSDHSEARAIEQCFGKNTVPVTAFKWALGHTLAGAGVIEVIMTILSLRKKIVPGIATLANKARACQSLKVSAKPQSVRAASALVIARGFASINTCLLLKALS